MRILRPATLLAFCLALTTPVHAAISEVPVGGINTLDLIETGVKGIPGCTNYCITGVCTHIQISLFSIKIIISPRIAHNTPEFVVSAFRAQGQQPWIEWRRVFGKAQANMADGLFGLVSGTGELGGYGTYTEEYAANDKQAPFKEVDINGHPLAMLPAILSRGEISFSPPIKLEQAFSIESQQTSDNDADSQGDQPNSEEEEYGEAEESASSIVDTSGFPAMFLDPEILDVFSYADTISQIGATVDQVSQVMDYFSQMSDIAGFGAGVEFSTEEMMCPNNVLPFTPYYLSAVDTLSWRVPWADVIRHAGDIGVGMIPFMPNRPVIGTASAAPGLGSGTWGGLYPRMGFVRNEHDGKVGAVASQRALDLMLARRGLDHFGHPIVFSPGFPSAPDWHIVPYEFRSSGVQGGVWQAVYPKPSYQCSASIYKDKTLADVAVDNSAPRSLSQNQNYIWAFWRRYECCMNRRGSFVAAAPLGPICLTGEQVEDPEIGFEGI